MVDTRTLLAAVLGVGLGVVLVAAPDAVIRVQTAGRLPSDRGGGYGQDREIPARWQWLVRLLGVVAILFGLYLGWTLV